MVDELAGYVIQSPASVQGPRNSTRWRSKDRPQSPLIEALTPAA